MIRAEEALRLPSAQLSEAELKRVDLIMSEIETGIRVGMKYNGMTMTLKESDASVIAAVHQRLKLAGFNAQWNQLVEAHRLNKALRECVGYQLTIGPSDEAYRAAEALSAIAQS